PYSFHDLTTTSTALSTITLIRPYSPFFFLNDTAPTEIYTLSLHDALPIFPVTSVRDTDENSIRSRSCGRATSIRDASRRRTSIEDRKSTRLNSSHVSISYAVFCLKKKNNKKS